MIYLNQASTTWPKPELVKKAVEEAIALPPFSQYRSSVQVNSQDVREQCRRKLAQLFHIRDEKRIYFTSGATDAFNRIVRGLRLDGKQVVITQTEHNAVLRPLYNIPEAAKVEVAVCDRQGKLCIEDLKNRVSQNTAAVFVNHCSNVTGIEIPLEEISRIVHDNGSVMIVDASQSAGIMDIDVERMGIDVLVFTGHKGLYGPQGTGGFYVRPGLFVGASVYGGTGRDSRTLHMPEDYEEQEAGTQNLQGIYGLCAGVDFVLDTGLEGIRKKEQRLLKQMKDGLSAMDKVTVYGIEESTAPVISFNMKGILPSDAAYILANSYDIVLRSGLQCAPLIHQALGSERHGTIRASFSFFNTEQEIEQFLKAVKELEQSL